MAEWKAKGYSDSGMRDASGVPISADLFMGRPAAARPAPKVQKPTTPVDPRELPHQLAVRTGKVGFGVTLPPSTATAPWKAAKS
jgi:hypothetical protein